MYFVLPSQVEYNNRLHMTLCFINLINLSSVICVTLHIHTQRVFLAQNIDMVQC